MKKVLLFNLMLLVSASTIQSKEPMPVSTTRTVDHPGNAIPVPIRMATTMPTRIQIPPFSEWVNITQTQMENIKPEDIIAKLSEVLEIEQRLAKEHLQLILNIIIHAMHRDPQLFKQVIHPMIVSLGKKMFTDAPQHSTETMVSLTTVRR